MQTVVRDPEFRRTMSDVLGRLIQGRVTHVYQEEFSEIASAFGQRLLDDVFDMLGYDVLDKLDERGYEIVPKAHAAAIEEISKRTFAVEHSPNCPNPFLVRLVGKGQYKINYSDADRRGYGQTFGEAAQNALAQP